MYIVIFRLQLLHISLPTLEKLTKEGTLPGYKIGSRILYKKEEIDNRLSSIQTAKYRRA